MGGVGAITAAILANRRAATLRQLHAVATTEIASSTIGNVVRLVGTTTLDGDARVAGPFSGTPCVIAVGERWEKTSRGQRVRRLERSVRASSFVLEDATGRVRIVANESVEVVVLLAPVTVATSGPNRVFGAGILAANLDKTQEILEGVIVSGARVTAFGLLQKGVDGTLELVGAPHLIVAEIRA